MRVRAYVYITLRVGLIYFLQLDLGLVLALPTHSAFVISHFFLIKFCSLDLARAIGLVLADVGLTVPPLNDKHALVIPVFEMECVMITITIRGYRLTVNRYRLTVNRLRGGSGGGYLRRKWLMKRLWWLRIQRAATGQRRH